MTGTVFAHLARACKGKLTYFKASYCADDATTLAMEGIEKRAIGAAGSMDWP